VLPRRRAAGAEAQSAGRTSNNRTEHSLVEPPSLAPVRARRSERERRNPIDGLDSHLAASSAGSWKLEVARNYWSDLKKETSPCWLTTPGPADGRPCCRRSVCNTE